jgi:hypothetical protein
MSGLKYLSKAEAEVYVWREDLSKEIKGMTIAEEVSYINGQAELFLKALGMEHLMTKAPPVLSPEK